MLDNFKDKNLVQKARVVNKKTDEVWFKVAKWIWLIVLIYILFNVIF